MMLLFYYESEFLVNPGLVGTYLGAKSCCSLMLSVNSSIYDNLDNLPVSNGRRSRKIDCFSIDYSKTWRQNGFNIIDRN